LSQAKGGYSKLRLRTTIGLAIVACLIVLLVASAGVTYAKYSYIQSQATLAVRSLTKAETSLRMLESSPLDTNDIQQARSQLVEANAEFIKMNSAIQALPNSLSQSPVVGSELDAAIKLGPIAVEVTNIGIIGCDTLDILAAKLQLPFATNVSGLTDTDMVSITAKFNSIYSLATTAVAQLQAVPPSASSLDPRIGPLLTFASSHLPQIEQVLQDSKAAVSLLPQLFGVGKAGNATYLLEILDSTELRPGGGYISGLGILTLRGGRMVGRPVIKDVQLLDQHISGRTLSLPPQYSWFTGMKGTSGFADSNLDADFPTDARRALQAYTEAGGPSVFNNVSSFQGVVAITPELVENALAITGPITMSQFGNTIVSSQNLIQEVHYWQLGPGLGQTGAGVDPACKSSYPRVFTCELFKRLLSALGNVNTKNSGKLGQLLVDSIHTKDLQMYFTAAGAENLLLHHDLASAVYTPSTGDSLMVVDANLSGVKANNYIQYSWSDQVTIDGTGNAVHHLSLAYYWPDNSTSRSNAYPDGNRGLNYQDYIRLYIPSDASIISLPRSLGVSGGAKTVDAEFGLKVIQGLVSEPIGTAVSLDFAWLVPHAATRTASKWVYQFSLEKQAGITRPMHVQLNLPTCSRVPGSTQGFMHASRDTFVAGSPLANDVTLSVQYTC
jgi:hypothetical protein